VALSARPVSRAASAEKPRPASPPNLLEDLTRVGAVEPQRTSKNTVPETRAPKRRASGELQVPGTTAATPIVETAISAASTAILSAEPFEQAARGPQSGTGAAARITRAPTEMRPPLESSQVDSADDCEPTQGLTVGQGADGKPVVTVAARGAIEPGPVNLPFRGFSGMLRLQALKNSGKNRGFQLVIALGMVLVGLAVFGVLELHGNRPPQEALQMAYPFGLAGGRMPNGRNAPPVSNVLFDYLGEVDCGVGECARYLAHTADRRFQVNMDMRRDDDGTWKLER
jgi:hypothetical protein